MSKPPVITPEAAAEELLNRALAKRSLKEFVKAAWSVVQPGVDFVDEWPVTAICEHLEAVYRGDIRRLLINQPPRTLKTTLTSVMFPVWVWLQDPTKKFIYASYTYTLAEDASILTRLLIKSPWFRARWGDRVAISTDRDTKEYLGLVAGGERIITSVDGTLTGRGAEIVVADDPNNPRNTSELELKSTLSWWTQVVPTRLNDPKTGKMIVVQQRVHENDVSGFILANARKDWVHLRLPMEFELASRCVTVRLPGTKGKPWADPRREEGELLTPKRVPRVEVERLKRALASQYAISGQLQQRPSPASGGIVKREWFKIWKSTERPKFETVILSIDPAMSTDKQAAFSAATTWGVFNDEHQIPHVMLLSMWRERCEYVELRERIQRMSKDYLDDGAVALKLKPGKAPNRRPDVVLIEAKGNGLSLSQDLMRAGVVVSRFSPDRLGDKTNRVRLVTPLLESKRVWVPGKAPAYDRPREWAEVFIEQVISFPTAASRDLVDCMTQALWRLQSSGFVWGANDRGPEDDTVPQVRPAESGRMAAFY